MNTDNENDPVEKAISKYKNRPSIISKSLWRIQILLFLFSTFQKIESQKQLKC